jgi:hypothetical protein
MQNKPFFPDLKKVKGVITAECEALTLKTAEPVTASRNIRVRRKTASHLK